MDVKDRPALLRQTADIATDFLERLPERPVERRIVAPSEPVVDHVAAYADDGHPGLFADLETFADGVLIGPVLPRQRLADDDNRLC